MFELGDVSTWSVEEARAQVLDLLPEKWHLSVGCDEGKGFWSAQITSLDGRGKENLVWEGTALGELGVLLDAFGYLWLSSQPKVDLDSPWVRKKPRIPSPNFSVSDKAPDPEDLDPDAVASVYASILKPTF